MNPMTEVSRDKTTHRPPLPNRGEVHVWTAWLDRADESAGDILDANERRRAQRFRFQRDRDRYVARRAFVRKVLGDYQGMDPGRLRFRVSVAGRPELDPPNAISFNVSHSAGLAVLAVARHAPVGVDVERARTLENTLDMAPLSLSAAESAWLLQLPEGRRSGAFLRLWTRKESVVKAMGLGLAASLDQIDVRASDGHRGQPRGPRQQLPFTFADLDIEDGFFAATTLGGSVIEPCLMSEVYYA